jgi:methyltransferase (TIGR00027 family)
MLETRPSRTAQRVAARRASHQSLDVPVVFPDPLAVAIAGAESAHSSDALQRDSRALRAFIAVRSRFAEDQLAAAIERGVRQYIVLGAGLDTFAYRNPFQRLGLHVFEVDHPATQEWKRLRLREAGIPIPRELTFAPVDFEREPLAKRLHDAGFRSDHSAFFSWLGVTPYLSRPAFDATVEFIAGLAPGSGVAFDYAVLRSLLTPVQQVALDALSGRVALAGEPFQLFFDPAEFTRYFARIGFNRIEDLGPDEINSRYFAERADGLAVSGGGHLLCAWLS